MQAIFKTSGSQFNVKVGQVLLVNKLTGEVGETVVFKDVLCVDNKFGAPLLAGASVKAKILKHDLGDKITVLKYKRRQNYRRKIGHRQSLTKLEITEISL